MIRVLMIDDDQKLGALLKEYFEKHSIQLHVESTPSRGLAALERESPELVLLDVMLPEIDGFEVCRQIRKSSNVPILMLTARGEVTDKVVGLELGADDYLSKPFEPRELVARILAILRRGQTTPEKGVVWVCDEIRVDIERRDASLSARPLSLTTSEFSLLKVFLENSGKALSRDTLIEKLRGLDWQAFDRSIDILVSRLRTKLGDESKNPKYIKTVWGTGYLWIQPLKREMKREKS